MSKETTFKLPQNVTQEEYDKAKAIIVSGFEAEQDPDVIKTAMFTEGIAFSKLLRIYKSVTLTEGLVIDPKVVKEGIENELTGLKIGEMIDEDTTYPEIQKVVDTVLKAVKGSTEAKVLSVIRTVFDSQDLDMPKKPKAARVTKKTLAIQTVVIDLFHKDADTSFEEMQTAIMGIATEGEAKPYLRQFKLFSALSNGLDAEEGLK